MFDQMRIFGAKPLKVDFWQSKTDLEFEKKKVENQQFNAFIQNLIPQPP